MENYHSLEILKIYFSKSIKIAEYLGHSIFEDFHKNLKNNTSNIDTINSFYISSKKRKDYSHNRELIVESLEIEYEKIALKDNHISINKIALHEQKINAQRENLMHLNVNEIKIKKFVVNPSVKTYESYWPIISDNIDYILNNNVEKSKGDFFFLYQKIGMFDALSQNNILEFQLTKYEYFIIQLFDNYKTADLAFKEFISVFEYNNQKEFKQIEKIFFKILKEMIYKKFIIIH